MNRSLLSEMGAEYDYIVNSLFVSVLTERLALKLFDLGCLGKLQDSCWLHLQMWQVSLQQILILKVVRKSSCFQTLLNLLLKDLHGKV